MAHAPDTVGTTFEQQIHGQRQGEVAVFICPECGGALWQVDQKDLVRFRCHVGHVYNGEHLLAEQAEALEAALWTAVRTFRERAILSHQLAGQERQRGNLAAAERFEDNAQLAERQGVLIQKYLIQGGPLPPESAAAEQPPAPEKPG